MAKKFSRKKTLDYYLGIRPAKHLEESSLILLTLALLVFVGGIALYVTSNNVRQFQPSQVQAKQIIGSVSLTIDFGSPESRKFAGDIYNGTTLYAALWQAAKIGRIQLHTGLDKNSGHVLFAGFDNKVNGKKGRWTFYINGRRLSGNIDETLLEAGDKILVRYE